MLCPASQEAAKQSAEGPPAVSPLHNNNRQEALGESGCMVRLPPGKEDAFVGLSLCLPAKEAPQTLEGGRVGISSSSSI